MRCGLDLSRDDGGLENVGGNGADYGADYGAGESNRENDDLGDEDDGGSGELHSNLSKDEDEDEDEDDDGEDEEELTQGQKALKKLIEDNKIAAEKVSKTEKILGDSGQYDKKDLPALKAHLAHSKALLKSTYTALKKLGVVGIAPATKGGQPKKSNKYLYMNWAPQPKESKFMCYQISLHLPQLVT